MTLRHIGPVEIQTFARMGIGRLYVDGGPTHLVVFIHGSWGKATQTWANFHILFPQAVAQGCDLLFYEYDGKFSTVSKAPSSFLIFCLQSIVTLVGQMATCQRHMSGLPRNTTRLSKGHRCRLRRTHGKVARPQRSGHWGEPGIEVATREEEDRAALRRHRRPNAGFAEMDRQRPAVVR